MSPKQFTLIINLFIILLILSTSIDSNTLNERDNIDFTPSTIAIVNKSGYNITHLPVRLEDGRFVKHDDHENIDINLKGIAIFTINDGGSSTFALFWDVPTIGPPNYEIEGLPNERYYNEIKYDLDNTLYQVTIHQYEHVKVAVNQNAVVNVWFIIPPYFFPPYIILLQNKV
ncbi:6558_t:CDS:2 [Funneliformis mosseae]|uniref:6558_t:CDS:1 n=1 Tax=Funneliformis mosseae TaxID=27381 RepID=A0A9N9GYM9_FUNMO|nr:6558_t:CDS:2 [Funneliformis mosseae]